MCQWIELPQLYLPLFLCRWSWPPEKATQSEKPQKAQTGHKKKNTQSPKNTPKTTAPTPAAPNQVESASSHVLNSIIPAATSITKKKQKKPKSTLDFLTSFITKIIKDEMNALN